MSDAQSKTASGASDRPAGRAEDPRVRFAAERTLLAWIRTGLAMMGFGFVVARFGLFLREVASFGQDRPIHHPGLSLWIGTSLVVLGVAANVVAAAEYVRVLRRIERGDPYLPPRFSPGVIVAVGLALLGIAIIAYLIRLIS
jgi:putative membrane protein